MTNRNRKAPAGPHTVELNVTSLNPLVSGAIEPATLPVNRDAERATLGAVLLEPDSLPYLARRLTPADFYDERNAFVYELMLELMGKRTRPDVVNLAEGCRARGRKELAPYLVDLSNNVPYSWNVDHYAAIVERVAVLRRMIKAGTAIAALGMAEPDDVDTALADAYRLLTGCARPKHGQDLFGLGDVFHEIMALLDPDAPSMLIPTGLWALDQLIGGLLKSDYYVLAGRPGLGKTSLALAAALHVAVDQGKLVVFVSLEMPRAQLVQRILSMLSGVPLENIITKRLTEGDTAKLVDAMARYSAAPFVIYDQGRVSIDVIRQKVAQAVQEGAERGFELGLMVCDYIQIAMGSGRYSGNPEAELSEISGALANLARAHGAPMLALSQLNRDLERRGAEAKRPTLADLRGSGSIEQDATGVLMIYRDSEYDEDADATHAEIIVAKNRHGAKGSVIVNWHGPTTLFKSTAPDYSIEGY